MGTIKAICTSPQKGTPKQEVKSALLVENYGIEGDAHAAAGSHRQVSMLPQERISEFKKKDAKITNGIFGENLIIDGIDELYSSDSPIVGRQLQIGSALLEITQIGKDCHDHCEIFRRVGECIMPKAGTFATVLHGGEIKVGDEARLLPYPENMAFTAAVITLSDKGFKNEREDKSGPAIANILTRHGYNIIEAILLPDDIGMLKKNLIRLCDQRQVNLIMTTGGTGFSPRDITPEATLAVATKNAPGIAEAIRAGSMQITRRAMLSREASVIRNHTLIINLPGSPKAVKECMDMIMDQLEHGLNILLERDGECGAS